MRKRWASHKSHVKHNFTNCNAACHYNDKSLPGHNWPPNTIDATLPIEISLTIIDKLNVEPWDTETSILCKFIKKEGYWQSQLDALNIDDGPNKRNEHHIANNTHT